MPPGITPTLTPWGLCLRRRVRRLVGCCAEWVAADDGGPCCCCDPAMVAAANSELAAEAAARPFCDLGLPDDSLLRLLLLTLLTSREPLHNLVPQGLHTLARVTPAVACSCALSAAASAALRPLHIPGASSRLKLRSVAAMVPIHVCTWRHMGTRKLLVVCRQGVARVLWVLCGHEGATHEGAKWEGAMGELCNHKVTGG